MAPRKWELKLQSILQLFFLVMWSGGRDCLVVVVGCSLLEREERKLAVNKTPRPLFTAAASRVRTRDTSPSREAAAF